MSDDNNMKYVTWEQAAKALATYAITFAGFEYIEWAVKLDTSTKVGVSIATFITTCTVIFLLRITWKV